MFSTKLNITGLNLKARGLQVAAFRYTLQASSGNKYKHLLAIVITIVITNL